MKASLPFILILLLFNGTNPKATAATASVKSTGPAFGSFAIIAPAQSTDMDTTVLGIRLNVAYGESQNMGGVDLGILVNNTRDVFAGIAFAGAANIVGKKTYIAGAQIAGLANVNRGTFRAVGFQFASLLNMNQGDGTIFGMQIAAFNLSSKTDVYGAQLGLCNKARKVVGLQIGLLNYANDLHGIQLGVLNFAGNTLLGMMPVFNIGF